MSLPTISIVTPSFNQAEFLETTMSSVLGHGYGGVEYVVVDGGSTDGSEEIIRRHEPGLAWWVSEPDGGHADAISKGFAHTRGEIMGWINSSDFYLPWTLQIVGEVFASHPEVDWVTGWPCMAGDDGVLRSTGLASVNRYDFLASKSVRIQQESTFWRRRLWDAAGGLNLSLRFAADLDLWSRFFGHAELYSVSCVLAAFRVHGQRLGTAVPDGYRSEAARSIQEMIDITTARDLRRAKIVAFSQAVAGSMGSSLLEVCPGCGWYEHRRISYDFGECRWRVQKARRLGSGRLRRSAGPS
jgi:glycosyltransferase involved in cell wall biosynthesis